VKPSPLSLEGILFVTQLFAFTYVPVPPTLPFLIQLSAAIFSPLLIAKNMGNRKIRHLSGLQTFTFDTLMLIRNDLKADLDPTLTFRIISDPVTDWTLSQAK
jgi:hypothetical protein